MRLPGKLLTGAVFAGVLALAAFLYLIWVDLEVIRESKDKRPELLLKYRAAAGLATNLETRRQQMRVLDERFGVALAILPNPGYARSPERLQSIETDIRRAAVAAGIGSPALSHGPNEHNESTTWRRIEVMAYGEYAQVVDFLQRISTASEFGGIVQYATIKPADSGKGVRLIAEILVYGFMDAETYAALKKGKP